ncbi:MAG: hypothetical protein J6R85_06045 [Lentisphaeria bacterium]|nr:hypothetical protein [Lentisphaeria bacterium]
MKSQSKFLATTKSKVIFCVGGLVFSLLMILINFDLSLASLFPNENALDDLERDLKKNKLLLNQQLEKEKAFNDLEKRYKELIQSGWVESRDGSPDVEIPKRINLAAQTHELLIQNVSAVRRTRLNDDLYLLEVDLNMIGTTFTITNFWNDLNELKPPMRWKRIDMRPEVMQSSDRVFFNGSLRILGVNSDLSAPAAPAGGTQK